MKSLKRFLVLALVAIVAVGSAQAQFRFGIKAGLNLNKLHFTEDFVEKNITSTNGCGWTAGVMTEFQIPVIGLCFDASLMYTRMNSDAKEVVEGEEYRSKSNNFFNIPINIKYKIGLPVVSNIITPYIFTGPDFAFKIGGKNDVFKTKPFQAAWNVGIGLELVRHLQISGSYGFGMNNALKLYNPMGGTVSDDIKAKNNYWTISAAYLF